MRHLAMLLVLVHLAAGQWLGWHAAWGHTDGDAAHAHHHHAAHDHQHAHHEHPQGDDDADCTWCQLAAIAQHAIELPPLGPTTSAAAISQRVAAPSADAIIGDPVAVTQCARAPPHSGPSTT